MKNLKIILIVAVAFIGGIGASSLWKSDRSPHPKNEHQDEPGHASHEEAGGHGHGHDDEHAAEGVINLSKDSQALGKFETAEVRSSFLTNQIPVTGRIAQDVENVVYAFPPRQGKLEKCFAHLGSIVKKDEILCVMKPEGSDELIEVKAPSGGIIIAEFIKAQEHIDQTTSMYTIADVSKLWANFDVYEKDIASVTLGQKVLVYPVSYPDKKFEGKIVFISPRVDESTYTVKIRVLVKNTDNLLKLGMFVRGEIVDQDKEKYLVVPSGSLQSVEGKQVVFVKNAAESFEAREVRIRSTHKGQVAISEGIKEGETVVTKGSFILKSKLLESEMEHGHSH